MPYRDDTARLQLELDRAKSALARAESELADLNRSRLRTGARTTGIVIALGMCAALGALLATTLVRSERSVVVLAHLGQSSPPRDTARLAWPGAVVDGGTAGWRGLWPGDPCELVARVVRQPTTVTLAISVTCSGRTVYRSWDDPGESRVLSRCAVTERADETLRRAYRYRLICFDQGPRTLRATLSVDTDAGTLVIGDPLSARQLRVRVAPSGADRASGPPLFSEGTGPVSATRWTGTIQDMIGRGRDTLVAEPGDRCDIVVTPTDEPMTCLVLVRCASENVYEGYAYYVVEAGGGRIVAAVDDTPTAELSGPADPPYDADADPILWLDAPGRRLLVFDGFWGGRTGVTIRLDSPT